MMIPYAYAGPIITERLELRMMTDADVDDVFAYQSREDVARYHMFDPRDLEQVREMVGRYAASTTLAADGDFLQFAIDLNGRVIGDIYFSISSVEHSRAELGWSIHPDFGGRGLATEAARAVLGLAFDTVRLHRVTATLDPRNESSIALCKRLGMREEAYLVEDLLFKGDWGDTGVYALLRNEWLERQ